MKDEYLSADQEPALRGEVPGPGLPLDPSEQRVADQQAGRGPGRIEEIDAIRDSIDSEPAIAGIETNNQPFAEWLAHKKQSVGWGKALFVALLFGLAAGPFAIIGALTKSPTGATSMIVYAVIFAPVIEEFLKQIGMIFVLERKPYLAKAAWQFPVAALIASAIFATVENLMYIHVYGAQLPAAELEAMARFRWPVCTALHMTCSFIASFGLVQVWKRQMAEGKPAQISHAFPVFAAAMAIHGIYNFAASFFIKIG